MSVGKGLGLCSCVNYGMTMTSESVVVRTEGSTYFGGLIPRKTRLSAPLEAPPLTEAAKVKRAKTQRSLTSRSIRDRD